MTHHALHEMKNWLRIKKHRENGLFADHTDLITYLEKVEKEMKELDKLDEYGNPGPGYFDGPSYLETAAYWLYRNGGFIVTFALSEVYHKVAKLLGRKRNET